MTIGRIIGLGHPFAGDDGVGLAVVAHLRAHRLADVDLRDVATPTDVATLLAYDGAVVIVDACVGARAGEVRQLGPDAIDPVSPFAASSHGVGLVLAIELGRALAAERFTPRLHIVAIAVTLPLRCGRTLSPAVAAAVPRAAATALGLVRRA